ncbi:MAG: hypothetical protein LBQ42_12805 [Synergistaceae bacterium]|nr:hypothetical protein [Synergistaceae bacterium]
MNSKRNTIRQDVLLCFCAAAGEKLHILEDLMGRLLSKAGFYVFTARRSGARGNAVRIRVSSTPVKAFVDRIDYLFLLSGGLRPDIMNHITSRTKVVGDVGTITRDSPKLREREAAIVELPIAARVKELDCAAREAEVLAGVTAALFGLTAESADALFERRFKEPEASALKIAFRLGHALGIEMDEGVLVARYLRADKKEILMDADTAISLGTVAGGCNFVAAPSSGTLFDFCSSRAEAFGTVAVRAEDRAGALNMCLGAAYTGARALYVLSGGSISEALESANLSETPLVIHTASRRAPNANMADVTDETADAEQTLNLALYSGRGEFPCAVYAPACLESAFALGARAFATAEKFRTPVVLMTDAHLSDIAYDIEPPCLNPESLPPRDVRGHDSGLSDHEGKKGEREGEEDQNVLKGLALKIRAVDKRVQKFAMLREDALPPTLFGDPLYQTLIVSWGSLQEPLLEALRVAETELRFETLGLALLSCEQLYPLSSQMEIFLKQARRLIFVENNATGQFARLVQAETGCVPTDLVLKYGEEPFSVEELVERLQNLLAPKEKEDDLPLSPAMPVVAVELVPARPVVPELLVVPSILGKTAGLGGAAGETNGGGTQ